jgi:hypothetical protein
MVVEAYQFRIRYTGWIAAFLRKADWNRQIEEPSWIDPLLLWKRDFRPKHFTSAAADLYGYTPRAGQDAPRGSAAFWQSYFGQKLRKLRHARPLEYTGQTEAETARGLIQTTAKGGKYRMAVTKARFRAPPAKYKTGPPPDLEAELTALSPAEQNAMIREKERGLLRRVRDCKTVIQETIGLSGA